VKLEKRSKLGAAFHYTKGFRLAMIVSFLLIGVELLISFISPLIMSVTIDSVLGYRPMNVAWYFSWYIVLIGGVEYIREHLWLMAATLLGMQIIAGVVRFIRAKLNTHAGEGSVMVLRNQLYAHIQRLPFSWHASSQTGDIIQRATNDIDTIRRFNTGVLLEFVRTILLLIVGAGIMFTIDTTLASITLGMLLPVFLTSVLFFRRISTLTNELETMEGEMFTVMQENLTGIRVVRAFGRSAFEAEKFNVKNEENCRRILKVTNNFSLLWSLLDILCGIEIAVIMIVGIYLVVGGSLTVGLFTAFTAYVFTFFWPIRGFGRGLSQCSKTVVAVGRIEEIFNAREEEDLDRGTTPPINGEIEFKDVSFSYGSVPVLDHFNMKIKGGSTVAFLGGTGSGKSTITLLLQRLYDPQSGKITVGGTDLTEIKKTHLRNRISMVMQEPFLYSKSILQNIGIKTRKPDEQLCETAAKYACVHDDIMEFEEKYNTLVGERGVTLSGGQKQRVAIARALTGESDVLIFDDSLSAVDTKTDASIRDALKEFRSGVTTIIISHRVTTLMEADEIFVIKNGKVAEQGTHEELMSLQDGIYRKTFNIQSSVVESA
jgi:ATP-binding cassette subfamily B protein